MGLGDLLRELDQKMDWALYGTENLELMALNYVQKWTWEQLNQLKSLGLLGEFL